MTNPLNYRGGRQFPQSILDDLDARLTALEAAPQPSQPVEAGETVESAVQHKPGCDALSGYGHGVGPCSCGAAPVLDDERAAFEELRSQMAYIAAYDPDESDDMSKDRLANRLGAIIARARRAANNARVASLKATETQLVGWFVQRSKFGPWVEVEQQEPGAEQFYRVAQTAQTELALTVNLPKFRSVFVECLEQLDRLGQSGIRERVTNCIADCDGDWVNVTAAQPESGGDHD